MTNDRPNLARIYDALLDGSDHYQTERDLVERLVRVVPEAKTVAGENRHWMLRTVRYLADKIGILQFIDLGSGLPTAQNTHEVAQKTNRDARVVYVDNDPVVQAHSRALLLDNDYTHVAGSDLTRPEETLSDPVIAKHLDLGQPVGLIVSGVLHHLPDYDQARAVLRNYVDKLAPGSYVALTHLLEPEDSGETRDAVRAVTRTFRDTAIGVTPRAREQIEGFFDGLELVPPGLTYLHEWWPDGPRYTPLKPLNFATLGGVARKN
ncbi:SAM-dependent methyltransferase [Amycolatopsis suaedae]|uniref:SAM-dependent methyltransferase n=1 Tax=Amycolatopsis suaedae TaxID=2510978 RepID=UPI001F0FC694|nr:SAM-dependent methyltransferase [Amycolatopsis suaedae]